MLHRAQCGVTCNLPPLFFLQCCVTIMPLGGGSKERSPFSHVTSRQHKAQRLQSLEDVATRELGAPYTVHHMPDTGQIVLAPVARGVGVQTL